jgi:phosphoserine phosphatase
MHSLDTSSSSDMIAAERDAATAPLPAFIREATHSSANDNDPRYRAEPAAAVEECATHAGAVLVDLDETLYLRNSTEDYLDCAWPGPLALILLRVLDVLKPWRFSGGEHTRDVWRVRLLRTLMPWTTSRWNRRVKTLAEQHVNRPLLSALQSRAEPAIIVTVGFRFIVTPLVEAFGLSGRRVVACEPMFADRRKGKLAMAIDSLGDTLVRRALLITDSLQDLPLLRHCARGLHVVWPDARYRRALSGVYLPGQYLSQVKRPGERYIVRGILQEDWAFWVLSSITLAAVPVLHVIGLLLLLVSFWAIYERGYVDNDLVGAKHEADPRLSDAFFEAPVATPRWQPWIWAAVIGLIGIFALRWPSLPTPLDALIWAGVLAATYGVFVFYNRLDKPTRVWVFPALQFARTTAFAALVPITPIGAVALAAHVIARWIPYYVYRLGGNKWPDSSIFPMRLLFFVVIGATLAMAEGYAVLLNLSAWLLLAWMVFRARYELQSAVVAARGVAASS